MRNYQSAIFFVALTFIDVITINSILINLPFSYSLFIKPIENMIINNH